MHRLQLLALAERVEHRRDRAELERVGAEEHQVVEHPVQLGEQGARPDRPLRHLHAEHLLDGEHHAELVGERRQPVVPVGQHDDLPVVADLEQLLGAAVHVADDRLGRDDPLAVEDDAQPQHAVRRRVLRADVEHHVGGREPAGAEPDVERALAGLGGHAVSLPHVTRGPRSAAGEGLAAGGPAVAVEGARAAADRPSGASASSVALTERVWRGSPAATQWCSRNVVPSRTGMSKVFLSFWLTYRFDPTCHDVTGRPCFAHDLVVDLRVGPAVEHEHVDVAGPLGAGDLAEVELRPLTSLVGALTLVEAVRRRRRPAPEAAPDGVPVTVTTTSCGVSDPQALRPAPATRASARGAHGIRSRIPTTVPRTAARSHIRRTRRSTQANPPRPSGAVSAPTAEARARAAR